MNFYIAPQTPAINLQTPPGRGESITHRQVNVFVRNVWFEVLQRFARCAGDRAPKGRRMLNHNFLARHIEIDADVKGVTGAMMAIGGFHDHAATCEPVEVPLQFGHFGLNHVRHRAGPLHVAEGYLQGN